MSEIEDVRDHTRFCSKAESKKYHITDVFKVEEEPVHEYTVVTNNSDIGSTAFDLSGRIQDKDTPPSAPSLFQVAWKGNVTGKVFSGGDIQLAF